MWIWMCCSPFNAYMCCSPFNLIFLCFFGWYELWSLLVSRGRAQCITIFVVYMRMHNVSDCYMYVMYCIINKHALRMYIYIYTLYSICTFLFLAILLLHTPSTIAAKFHHIWWHLLESQRPQQVWSSKMLQTCGQTAEPSKTGAFATETIKNDSWTGRYPGTWQLQRWWCY